MSSPDHRVDILGLSGNGRKVRSPEVCGPSVKNIHSGQHVQIEGRKEVFVVLRIDRERHLADLLKLGTLRKVETGVSIATLRPVKEPQADGDVERSA